MGKQFYDEPGVKGSAPTGPAPRLFQVGERVRLLNSRVCNRSWWSHSVAEYIEALVRLGQPVYGTILRQPQGEPDNDPAGLVRNMYNVLVELSNGQTMEQVARQCDLEPLTVPLRTGE